MNNLMLNADIPVWATQSFPVIRIVLFAIIAVCALALIIVILFQNEEAKGMDAITGQQESYYSQNKGDSRDGKLKIITIVLASVIAVCTLLYFISFLIVPISAL